MRVLTWNTRQIEEERSCMHFLVVSRVSVRPRTSKEDAKQDPSQQHRHDLTMPIPDHQVILVNLTALKSVIPCISRGKRQLSPIKQPMPLMVPSVATGNGQRCP